jgi:hypothetical protein
MNNGFPFSRRSANFAPAFMRPAFVFAIWLLTLLSARAELSVGKAQWGFDGVVVAENFNLVTVEVRNDGSQAFDGVITFDDGGGFVERSALAYRQHVYLAPGTARTVQFYPYLRSASEWRLKWGPDRAQQAELGDFKYGAPAVVILRDPDSVTARQLRMPAFSDAYFPPTASATDGLHAVVLDHVPKWDAPRRQAFVQWLRRGGIVHLVRGPAGTHPEFSEELAVLNGTDSTKSVGAGVVARHDLEAGDVTSAALQSAGFPTPQKSQATGYDYTNVDHSLFQQLKAATKPKIAWDLIYFLTFVYIVLIGPVFYFQRKRDYRFLLGGFLALVALFAWIFGIVGRRGYGEKQLYHSLAVARSVGDGKWDVRHWVHAFATSGDAYQFRFAGSGQLYGMHAQDESARGEVIQGKDSYFSADIPLFSSRGFLHQGVMDGPKSTFQATGDITADRFVAEFAPKTDDGLKGKVLSMTAQIGDKFYELRANEDRWRVTGSGGTFSTHFETSGNRGYYYYGETPETLLARWRNSPGELMQFFNPSRSSGRHIYARPVPPGTVRIFTYCEKPGTFPLQNADFQVGFEFVLFVEDIRLTQPRTASHGPNTRH